METYVCPRGHASTEGDYCSECGAKIGGQSGSQTGAAAAHAVGATPPSTPILPAASGTAVCPECGTPREANDAVFCEICGYNFVTGARGELPFVTPSAPPPQPAAPPESVAPATTPADPGPDLEAPPPVSGKAVKTWEVTVTVDPSLREEGSPQPSAGVGPFVFALAEPVSLIGRRSETRAVFPQIPLGHDDAVSHRHALLQIEPGGTLLLRDIGASNGTRLNGTEIVPMVDHPLQDGDAITLGHWTRLTVRGGR